MKLSAQSTIKEIYETEQGRAVLERYLPKLLRTPTFQMTLAMSFEAVCKFRRWRLKRAVYEEALEALSKIHTKENGT